MMLVSLDLNEFVGKANKVFKNKFPHRARSAQSSGISSKCVLPVIGKLLK